jgi:CRISPR-associated protein Csd2
VGSYVWPLRGLDTRSPHVEEHWPRSALCLAPLLSINAVIAFRHSSALGNAPAWSCSIASPFSGNSAAIYMPVGDDKLDNAPPARRYQDYEVSVRDGLPDGIDLINVL